MTDVDLSCPCGSGRCYRECCQPLHLGDQVAISAEQLMRSRYCAFVLKDSEYLHNSWHVQTRPETMTFEDDLQWQGLKILRSKKGRSKDQEGWVTFKAFFVQNGTEGVLHEKSYFVRNEQGHWVYVDGKLF